MKVTIKGQITVPKDIREKSGILPHTDVEFILRGKDVLLRRVHARQHRGDALIARMRSRGGSGLSTDQIMKLTRG